MNCPKCDKETENYFKFCSNCRIKVEEKPIHVQFDESIEKCSKIWYIIAYIRGININDKKSLKEFIDLIKKNPGAAIERVSKLSTGRIE